MLKISKTPKTPQEKLGDLNIKFNELADYLAKIEETMVKLNVELDNYRKEISILENEIAGNIRENSDWDLDIPDLDLDIPTIGQVTHTTKDFENYNRKNTSKLFNDISITGDFLSF